MPRLVAAATSGDLFITANGAIWHLHRAAAAGGVERITPERAAVIIDRADLEQLDLDFDNYPEIEAHLESRADEIAVTPVDATSWSPRRIRETLELVDRMANDGEVDEALEFAQFLVDLEQLHAEPRLRRDALALYGRLLRYPTSPLR